MAENSQINPTARVAKNSLVQMLGGVLNKILGVLVIIYAARQLNTSGFGVYSFVLSVLSIFNVFTDFGLGRLVTRDLARTPGEESRYLGNVMLMRVLSSLVSGIGMVVCVAVLGHPVAVVQFAAVAALSLFFASNVDTCASMFYAHEQMEIPAMVSVIASMIRVGVSLGALAAGGGVLALLWIYTISLAVHFLLLYILIRRKVKLQFVPDWKFWKHLLVQSYPLALANLFQIVYFKVDTVMLASISGERAVGLYNAAYRMLEFTLIVPAYYGGAIYPVISASQVNNPQRFMLIYRRSLKYMLVASLPLALGASALAPGIIEVIYGPMYAGSMRVLRILMWTLVLISVNSINSPYLIAMGRQKTITLLMSIGMTFNFLLNLYAIPRYGVIGAGWVTLLSEILNIILFLIVLAKPLSLEFKMLRHALRPVLAGLLMYAGLRMIPEWDLGFQVLLGGVVYVALLFAFHAFDEVDMELFSRVLRPTWFSGTRLT